MASPGVSVHASAHLPSTRLDPGSPGAAHLPAAQSSCLRDLREAASGAYQPPRHGALVVHRFIGRVHGSANVNSLSPPTDSDTRHGPLTSSSASARAPAAIARKASPGVRCTF